MSENLICARCKTPYPQGRPATGLCLNCGCRDFLKSHESVDVNLSRARQHRSSDFYDPSKVREQLESPREVAPREVAPREVAPPSAARPRPVRPEDGGPKRRPPPAPPGRPSAVEVYQPQAVSQLAEAPSPSALQRPGEPRRPGPPLANDNPYLAAVADVAPDPPAVYEDAVTQAPRGRRKDIFSTVAAEASAFHDYLAEEEADPNDTSPALRQVNASPLVWSPGSSTQSELIAGRYLIRNPRLDLLGTGAKGVVYKAYDTRLGGRKVAVKLFFDAFGDMNDPEIVEEEKNRTQREIEIQGDLTHPGIVTIYDRFESDHGNGVVLEFVDGETLEDRIENPTPISIGDAVRFTIELAKAVEFMHQNGFIHRDIKPGNVLITRDENAKLIDFGLSKQKGAPDPFDNTITRQLKLSNPDVYKTQEGDIVGTPAYMSPEQASGRLSEVDERSDVYGLGAVLYHCLTGDPPVNKETIEEVLDLVIEGAIPAPRSINPKIDAPLEAIVMTSLARDREGRFASALALREQLVRYQDGQPLDSAIYREPLTVRATRWLAKHKTSVIVFSTILISATTLWGGYWFYTGVAEELQSEQLLLDARLLAAQGKLPEARLACEEVRKLRPGDLEALSLRVEIDELQGIVNDFEEANGALERARSAVREGAQQAATRNYILAEEKLKQLTIKLKLWKGRVSRQDGRVSPLSLPQRITSAELSEWLDEARGLMPFAIATPRSEAFLPTAALRLYVLDEQLESAPEGLFDFDPPNSKTELLTPVTEMKLPLGIFLAELEQEARIDRFPVRLTRGSTGVQATVIGPLPESPKGMVYVFGQKNYRPGHPRHDDLASVDVAPFFMQVREVTIRDYVLFLQAVERESKSGFKYKPYTWLGLTPPIPDSEWERPITDVSHEAAIAYADWLELRTGLAYRLPTEAEWQLAASGAISDRDYPYGQRFHGEWSHTQGPEAKKAGSHPRDRSPFGVLDMGGNVAEWVQTPDAFEGGRQVAKGGSFNGRAPVWARQVVTQSSRKDIGFRCVINAPPIPAWNPRD